MYRSIKGLIRELIRIVTGLRIEKLNNGCYAIYKDTLKGEAWFSNWALIEHLMGSLGIDLVIDAGANEGQFAKQLRRFYAGDIISFEPSSSAFEKLKINAAGDPNWQVYNMALGRNNEKRILNTSERSDLNSFLEVNKYCIMRFGAINQMGKEEVEVRRLDGLANDLSDVATKKIFLKMDTQGYDLEVFKGSKGLISNIIMVQTEVSLIPIYEAMPSWIEVISHMQKAGYNVVGMFPVSRDSNKIIEYDCLMIK